MKTVRIKINPELLDSLPSGHNNKARLDATTEQNITEQKAVEDAEAMLDAAKFARRVRKRLGLSQLEFSHRIVKCRGERVEIAVRKRDYRGLKGDLGEVDPPRLVQPLARCAFQANQAAFNLRGLQIDRHFGIGGHLANCTQLRAIKLAVRIAVEGFDSLR